MSYIVILSFCPKGSAPLVSYRLLRQTSEMFQSAHQGLADLANLYNATIDHRLMSKSSNRPSKGNFNSDDSSGRSSPYTESMVAEDEERTHKIAKRLIEALDGISISLSPVNHVDVPCG
jgi:hypothetical protein